MPRKPRPCRSCGEPCQVGPTSSLEPMCRPCRRLNPQRHPKKYVYPQRNLRDYRRPAICVACGRDFLASPARGGTWAVHCSQRCVQAMRAHRSPDDPRVRRWQREVSAPGLTETQRGHLRAKWRRQGRICSFCPELASTVDHVVPFIRGGTNWEGNLVPACRAWLRAWRGRPRGAIFC